jgi:hypothetical protein
VLATTIFCQSPNGWPVTRQVGVRSASLEKIFGKYFFRESVLSQFKEIGEETGCVGTGEKDEEIRQHQNLLNHFGME